MYQNKTQLHWEKIGGNYSRFWKSEIKNELSKKELQFINDHISKTEAASVLDIGIGSGRLIQNYLNNKQVKEIYGIDWAKSMVVYCRNKFKGFKKIKKIERCNISEEEIFRGKTYDFVSAVRVLKYNDNWRNIIGKIIKKIKNDGIVVFTMPNRNALSRVTKHETGIHETTKDEIEKIVTSYGGKVIEIKTFGKLPDFLYDVTNDKVYVKTILFIEGFLRNIFGDIFLGKIFFVAVKRSLS